MASISGMSWVTSCRLPPVSVAASGMPPASVITWCLDPARARSTGLGPVLAPLLALARATRPPPPATSRSPGGVEPGQQHLVQPLPHSRLVPVPQPPPAGHPRPVSQLLRRELPRDAGVQHEQDPAQRVAVIQPPPAGMPEPPLRHRQQRLDQLPQAVLDLPGPAL